MAVCVAEALSSGQQNKTSESVNPEDEETKEASASATDDDKISDVAGDLSALAHPPDMPIVIDEAALEDILGVRLQQIYWWNYKRSISIAFW